MNWIADPSLDGEQFRIWIEGVDSVTIQPIHDVQIDTRERTFTVEVSSEIEGPYIASLTQLTGPEADGCPVTGSALLEPNQDVLELRIDGDACSGG